MLIPSLGFSAGETPGTYTYYQFSNATSGFESIDFDIKINKDAGYSSNIFWSNQFGIVGSSSGAYTGFQSNGGKKRTFLFSVWDAVESKKGSKGSYCLKFEESSFGQGCRIHVDWSENNKYQFHVAYEYDHWLSVTVTNLTKGSSFKIGSIKTRGDRISSEGMFNWTEYSEWNNDRTTCLGQPYSKAIFFLPQGTLSGKKYDATISSTSLSSMCQKFSNVIRTREGSVHENGIGNSERGSVKNDKFCLDVEKGLGENRAVILYPCHGRANQSWVFSKASSIETPHNYCLTNKNGIRVTTCNHRDRRSQWIIRGSKIKNKFTGACLTGNGYHKQVTLKRCNNSVSQKWSFPW